MAEDHANLPDAPQPQSQANHPAPALDAFDAAHECDDDRITYYPDRQTVEIDFSDLSFETQRRVNAFFDTIEYHLSGLTDRVYLLLNYDNFRVERGAYLAYGVRGKRLRSAHARGAIRYARSPEAIPVPHIFDNRTAAFRHIDAIRTTQHPPRVRA